jgi:deazaflavin-dependent oxidoreductase (nitroreductase family)
MRMANSVASAGEVPRFVDVVLRRVTRVLNPLIMRVAGGWFFPMFAVVHHRGHRSGRRYSTPVTAIPRGGWFWFGLTFGTESGWARNVLANGECEVRYRGADYQLIDPSVLDYAAVRLELPLVMRFAVPLTGVHKVLRLRIAHKD